MVLRKFFKDCFTGKDNESFSLPRLQWFIATVFLMGMDIYSVVYRGNPFDPVAFATGMGGLLAAGGLTLALGSGSEPSLPFPPPPPPPPPPVPSPADSYQSDDNS